ncbi:hypothetical protein WUBG_13086, partial [Wuchereria bancrofti]
MTNTKRKTERFSAYRALFKNINLKKYNEEEKKGQKDDSNTHAHIHAHANTHAYIHAHAYATQYCNANNTILDSSIF